MLFHQPCMMDEVYDDIDDDNSETVGGMND
jgi:hypothetical protein